jgi:hypothetical protein
MTPRQEIAALRDFDPVDVRSGVNRDRLIRHRPSRHVLFTPES